MTPEPEIVLKDSLPPMRKIAPEATARSEASSMRSLPAVCKVPALTVVAPV